MQVRRGKLPRLFLFLGLSDRLTTGILRERRGYRVQRRWGSRSDDAWFPASRARADAELLRSPFASYTAVETVLRMVFGTTHSISAPRAARRSRRTFASEWVSRCGSGTPVGTGCLPTAVPVGLRPRAGSDSPCMGVPALASLHPPRGLVQVPADVRRRVVRVEVVDVVPGEG